MPANDAAPASPGGPEFDRDAGARGAVYALLARVFEEPGEIYPTIANGRLDAQCRALVGATDLAVDPPDLTTDDDRDDLCARYNDLFVIGYSEVIDGTDGTVANEGPPVPLYESEYRTEVSWNDVNLDLARAYEYFGVEVDADQRENHDHLRLQLEFMGYLCRREAAVDAHVAAARLDFHDRHLRVVSRGVADRIADEPGSGFYGEVAAFLDRFSSADVEDLDERIHGGPAGGSAEGSADGSAEGSADGSAEGSADGSAEGSVDRPAEGSADGSAEGSAEGGVDEPNADGGRRAGGHTGGGSS